jgi:ABC-type Fe3+ transport system permease subunit
MWFLYAILLGVFVALLVWIGAWYRQARRRMTPEQRQKEDESLKRDGPVASGDDASDYPMLR